MRRRSPGGARVSSVSAGPEKMSSSSASISACFCRQAAFFSGEHPQWAESGFPPQLPERRFPWSMTPRAMTPIRTANPTTEMSRVATTIRGLAVPAANATERRNRMTNRRFYRDECQRNVALHVATRVRPRARSSRCFTILYLDVTRSSSGGLREAAPSNRYVEATRHSRTSSRTLVLGRPSTQKKRGHKGDLPDGIAPQCSNRKRLEKEK